MPRLLKAPRFPCFCIPLFSPLWEKNSFTAGWSCGSFRSNGNVFAIVVSAALFGVMHANLFQMIFAFLTGLVLGYTAAEFSLRWSIVLHLVNNLVFGELLGGLADRVSLPCRTGLLLIGESTFSFSLSPRSRLVHHREQPGDYLQKKHRFRISVLCRAFNCCCFVAVFCGTDARQPLRSPGNL